MSKAKDIVEIVAQWQAYERPEDGQVFEHYKGGLYSIVTTGFLEDTETPCVAYRSHKKDLVWVRTAKNFFEEIEHAGEIRPRFRRVDDAAQANN